ncbi:hypothetical protein [Streptomyces sp. H27-C3]|uniref:hypothetical protein n=1 Tax=Streptomyces sp. H27-C3 TaxID=3046305 RepID=UPI0024B9DD47|nr:hypothetical protein [Streptomyces sp. H27-C3]MDJ0465409.1 hypothetical protein [Streptomyces sp. H27-C3]
MSRETDSSSSGPQGRGGAAYPSGTPPYGSRQYPSPHPAQDAPEEASQAAPAPVEPDEPRTETTLTTRIRINIPGSRPIPPVVMRTPMSDLDPAPGAAPAAASEPAAGSGTRGAGNRNGNGAGNAGTERTSGTPWPEAKREGPPPPAERGDAGGEEKPGAPSDWFAPRKSAPGAPGPAAPTPPQGGGQRPDLPYFTPDPQQPQGGRPRSALSDLDTGNGGPPPGGFSGGGPSGPTTGPATGSSPLSGYQPGLPGTASSPESGPMSGYDPNGPTPGYGPAGPPSASRPGNGARPPGGDPSFDPQTGAPFPPRLSDDTAVLTPQKPAPGGGNVSGDTLSSGIPVVPSADRHSPFPTGPQAGGGNGQAARFTPDPTPRLPDGAKPPAPGPAAAPARATTPPAKKGRSKLVLAAVGVVGLAGVAYGAGLLMNHSDVPKGTTVLGVDIGGGTREEAVGKLDGALGKRAASPLQLTVDGEKTKLSPEQAGLTLDSQETVRAAAGADYNPVSVIGSLFGGERVAEPVLPADEEKLSVALADLAGDSGTAVEGTVTFVPGKAVAVPGKSGKQLDVNQSVRSVKDAYRAQVETGKPNVVELPVASKEPTITQAEISRAMKEFAEPAMSGLITIKAGGKQIQFGPERSLPKILSMKAIDGTLVPVYNKPAIQELLDGVFDGVLATKGDGKKHQITADDVAQAMQTALIGKTPAERIQEINLNGS